MNEQTFANFRLKRGKLQSAILILSCFLGLILLAQLGTHSQIGEQPQQSMLATSSIGVTASNRNPLQIALLHWYDDTTTVTKLRASDGLIAGVFTVGQLPLGSAFDGTNIWAASSGPNTVTKLQASDGSVLGTFTVGNGPFGVAFDGANIWAVNNTDSTVIKFRARDGVTLGTFSVGNFPHQVAFDGANIWVTNTFSNSVSKL